MISHLNNHGATDRLAAVDLESQIFREIISALIDAGFDIVGSLRSRPEHEGSIRLLIRGSALPEECKDAIFPVNVTLTLESYGEQRITRISAVEICGPALSRSERAA